MAKDLAKREPSRLDEIARLGQWLAAAESGDSSPNAQGATAALRLYYAAELGLTPMAAAELSVIKGRSVRRRSCCARSRSVPATACSASTHRTRRARRGSPTVKAGSWGKQRSHWNRRRRPAWSARGGRGRRTRRGCCGLGRRRTRSRLILRPPEVALGIALLTMSLQEIEPAAAPLPPEIVDDELEQHRSAGTE